MRDEGARLLEREESIARIIPKFRARRFEWPAGRQASKTICRDQASGRPVPSFGRVGERERAAFALPPRIRASARRYESARKCPTQAGILPITEGGEAHRHGRRRA